MMKQRHPLFNKVSGFMQPARRGKKSKTGRHRTTYRAARRNIAKIGYRRQKKQGRGQ
jgi:hypothetical protein